jgi:hypothetical protein
MLPYDIKTASITQNLPFSVFQTRLERQATLYFHLSYKPTVYNVSFKYKTRLPQYFSKMLFAMEYVIMQFCR